LLRAVNISPYALLYNGQARPYDTCAQANPLVLKEMQDNLARRNAARVHSAYPERNKGKPMEEKTKPSKTFNSNADDRSERNGGMAYTPMVS